MTATDDGVPARSSTATLTVILSDINDCPPRLAEDYRPVVHEHEGAMKIAEIRAVDDDERPNGPPFSFSIDPSASEEIRRSFRLDSNPSEWLTADRVIDNHSIIVPGISFDSDSLEFS